jgi:hypothetical protein
MKQKRYKINRQKFFFFGSSFPLCLASLQGWQGMSNSTNQQILNVQIPYPHRVYQPNPNWKQKYPKGFFLKILSGCRHENNLVTLIFKNFNGDLQGGSLRKKISRPQTFLVGKRVPCGTAAGNFF